MLCYLSCPLLATRSIAVEIEGNFVYSTHIVEQTEQLPVIDKTAGNPEVLQCVRAFFDTYFSDNATPETVSAALKKLLPYLAPAKSDFAARVRNTLIQQIELGDSITYHELACRIGNPKATRAVGQALNKNPFHIIVPCHRVVSKDPDKVFYAAGADVKRALLHYEAECIHAPMTAMIPF